MRAPATYKARKIEFSLVEDITGSMCDTPPAAGDPPCTSAAKLSVKLLGDASKAVRLYTVAFQAPTAAETMMT